MPSLKSSSKGGDTIALFATERRAMTSTYATLAWLSARLPHQGQADECLAARDLLAKVLQMFPSNEKFVTDKPAK